MTPDWVDVLSNNDILFRSSVIRRVVAFAEWLSVMDQAFWCMSLTAWRCF